MNPISSDELRATLALTCTPHIGVIIGRQLIEALGTATAVYQHRTELPELVPGVRPSLISALDNSAAFHRADQEMRWIEQHHIHAITIHDPDYPSRLRECDDAPLVLYTCGKAALETPHVVSIVGTRKATDYGRDICASFVRDLAQLCPDALIVSGLAYGIDIAAHRAALANNLPTLAVLAHGLDRIYPSAHRNDAAHITSCGALVTEYMTLTEPERQNFVHRNRIIAGLADVTVVIQSAARGGSLITAELAQCYNRECLAFPGRINDEASRGCNKLINSNAARLITSAEDLMNAMNWPFADDGKQAIQRELFVNLTPEEEIVMNVLRNSPDPMQINLLVVECDIPVARLSTLLFNLELKGAVRNLPGARYKALD